MPYPQCECDVCLAAEVFDRARELKGGDMAEAIALLTNCMGQTAAAINMSQEQFAETTQSAFLRFQERFSAIDDRKKRMN